MGEGSKNAETIVCVAFGASWTSKVIPHLEAFFGSRTRTVFLGCFGRLLGAFRSILQTSLIRLRSQFRGTHWATLRGGRSVVSAFTAPWPVCVSFGVSWTSKVISHFYILEAFCASRIRTVVFFVSDGFRELSARFPKVFCMSV